MILRIKKQNDGGLRFYFCLMLILDLQFFHLVNLPFLSQLNTVTNKILISLMTLFLVFVILISSRNVRYCWNHLKFYVFYYVFLGLFLILISLYSMPRYNETVMDMYISLSHWIIMGLIPVCYFLFDKDKNKYTFLDLINGFVMFDTILVLIYAIVCNITGIEIFAFHSTITRSGRVRYTVSAYVPFFLVYNYVLISHERIIKNKVRRWGNIFIMLLVLLLVDMTRAKIVSIFAALILVYYIKKKRSIMQVILFTFSIIAVILFLQSDYIALFIDSFSSGGLYAKSTIARTQAIEYFSEYTQANPLFGMGVVRPYRNDLNYIRSGPYGIFHFDDIGILGQYYNYGIIGVCANLIPIVRLVYVMLTIHGKDLKVDEMLFGWTIYCVVTMISLCVYDPQRIFIMPIILAYAEYQYRRLGSNSNTKKRKLWCP